MLDYVILRYNFIIKGRLWNNYDLPSPNLNEPNLTFTSSPAALAAKAARSAYAMAARALPKTSDACGVVSLLPSVNGPAL
jgi:hypothetical protein